MIRAVLVFSFILAAVGFGVNAHATFGNISLTSPKMVSLTGQELTSMHVGQQIGVQSVIANHAASEKRFTYLVQVLNNKGQTEYFEGSPHQFFLTNLLLFHNYGFQKNQDHILYRHLFGIVCCCLHL